MLSWWADEGFLLKHNKLSDLVGFGQDADRLMQSVIHRLQEEVDKICREKCLKENRTEITKADVLSALRQIGPIYGLVDPED